MSGRRGKRRRLRWSLFWATVVAGAAWTVGLVIFAAAVPKEATTDPRRADAIVVLTGGSERLAEGLRLLADDRGRKLFVSGVYRGVDVAEILRVTQQTATLAQRIALGHEADDTLGNARETARWMAREGYNSLNLVTSAYHMPRSLFEFRHALPTAEIFAHPVFADSVRDREWWRWRGTTMLYAREYTKYLLARLRARVAPVAMDLLRES